MIKNMPEDGLNTGTWDNEILFGVKDVTVASAATLASSWFLGYGNSRRSGLENESEM